MVVSTNNCVISKYFFGVIYISDESVYLYEYTHQKYIGLQSKVSTIIYDSSSLIELIRISLKPPPSALFQPSRVAFKTEETEENTLSNKT